MTLVVSRLDRNRRSRWFGISFDIARLLHVRINCTPYGSFTGMDSLILTHNSTHVDHFRLCIPTDNDRPYGFLRSGFFSKPTGFGTSGVAFCRVCYALIRIPPPSVPVIGVFTKLDGRETKVMAAFFGPDPSPSDFLHPPPEIHQGTTQFVEELETKFRKLPHPPTAFVRVRSTCMLSD